MKKRLLSLLTALCLMIALAPAVFAEGNTMEEQAFRDAVAAGGTVTMTGDVTLTSTLVINKGVTINGSTAKYSITYVGTADVNAIRVNTNEAVRLQSLSLNVTQNGGRGVELNSTKPNFTVANCILNVDTRGIWVNPADTLAGTAINVLGTTIQNSRKPSDADYNTWSTYGDTRGISLWDMTGANIKIQNSHIYGFGYTVNLAGNKDHNGVCDFGGTTLTVTNSDLFGWTAFNVWSSNTKFVITNSHLRGINLSTGSSDSFATIVVNDDIYNQFDGATAKACHFDITGGVIDNYLPQSTLDSAAAGNSVCVEFLFRIDDEGVTTATFKNKVQFKDNSDLLYAAFRAGNQAPTTDFYNYIYGLDGTERIQLGDSIGIRSDGTTLPFAVLPGAQ